NKKSPGETRRLDFVGRDKTFYRTQIRGMTRGPSSLSLARKIASSLGSSFKIDSKELSSASKNRFPFGSNFFIARSNSSSVTVMADLLSLA
ncbi:MAG: hypothetical protein P4L58_03995, partial [Candidatus Pacebacteria bacterium]|nr:hypothetical protein [Candidatus Paceibacterota bacterium]